jgi:hypothetical protein
VQLGIAIGFIITPVIVSTRHDIPHLLLVEAILCTVVGAVVMAAFQGNPPTPPTASARYHLVSFEGLLQPLTYELVLVKRRRNFWWRCEQPQQMFRL